MSFFWSVPCSVITSFKLPAGKQLMACSVQVLCNLAPISFFEPLCSKITALLTQFEWLLISSRFSCLIWPALQKKKIQTVTEMEFILLRNLLFSGVCGFSSIFNFYNCFWLNDWQATLAKLFEVFVPFDLRCDYSVQKFAYLSGATCRSSGLGF